MPNTPRKMIPCPSEIMHTFAWVKTPFLVGCNTVGYKWNGWDCIGNLEEGMC